MIAAALSLFLAPPATAANDYDRKYENCRLQVSDLPPAAPRFADFPVKPEPVARPSPPKLTSPMARHFRTELKVQAKLGPDFAGRYRVAVWGCGTGCESFAVIDLKTGAVSFPPGLTGVEQGEASPLDDLTYRMDSRLLIVTGSPDEEFKGLGMRFYVMGRNGLRLIKTLSYAEVCPATSN